MGHAIHMEPGPFQKMVKGDLSRKILRNLGIDQVSVPQSMYIFKQAKFGSAVPPHQVKIIQKPTFAIFLTRLFPAVSYALVPAGAELAHFGLCEEIARD